MQPPEHILDNDFMIAINRIKNNNEKNQENEIEESHVKYIPSIGLLLKLLKGSRRLWKRGKILPCDDEGVKVLYDLWRYYAIPSYDINYWTPIKLHKTAIDINKICREISPAILRDLDSHLLIPSEDPEDIVYFERNFLLKVAEYHKSLERPDTTFSTDKILIEDSNNTLKYIDLIQKLAQLPREICSNCNGKRHIYCGDCQGLRMSKAEEYLPNRIILPVNIALLLHWRESLHKCTGIHAAVLSMNNTVECISWPKENHEDNHPGWDDIVRQFDSKRDVILYPYDDSISAEEFPWWENSSSSSSSSASSLSSLQTGYRLIVLEGSWEGAKTMANRITTLRERLGLEQIPSITLPDGITSHYWRLQHMGSSAVSTIEAIAHTISIIEKLRLIKNENFETKEDNNNDNNNNMNLIQDQCQDHTNDSNSNNNNDNSNTPEKKKCRYENEIISKESFGTLADILLLLFNLQRHRMLTNVKDGAKVPMAIAASNNQGYTTSWSSIISKELNKTKLEN